MLWSFLELGWLCRNIACWGLLPLPSISLTSHWIGLSLRRYYDLGKGCSFHPRTVWFCVVLTRVRLCATPWTVACQSALSMGFSRQEYWSGLPFPPPGDLPHPGIEPGSPSLWADALLSEPPGKSQFYSWPLANDAPVANIVSAFLHLFTNRDTKWRWCTRDCGTAEKVGQFLEREDIWVVFCRIYRVLFV